MPTLQNARPVMTKHAEQAWAARFAHLDLMTEWVKATKVGKKTRRRIKDQCKAHAWQWASRDFKGKYALVSPSKVVFVVAPPNVVVTVFPLQERNDERVLPRDRVQGADA